MSHRAFIFHTDCTSQSQNSFFFINVFCTVKSTHESFVWHNAFRREYDCHNRNSRRGILSSGYREKLSVLSRIVLCRHIASDTLLREEELPSLSPLHAATSVFVARHFAHGSSSNPWLAAISQSDRKVACAFASFWRLDEEKRSKNRNAVKIHETEWWMNENGYQDLCSLGRRKVHL